MLIKYFSSAIFYQKISRGAVYFLCFFLPIFFLPLTVEPLESGKQLLLVVLSLVAFLAWFGSVVTEKKMVCRGGWLLNLSPLLLLIGIFVSSFFSLAGYQTWLGQSSREYVSFLTTIIFVVFFFTVKHLADNEIFRKTAFACLAASGAISAIVVLPNLFGWKIVPFLAEQGANPVGTLPSFVVFLTIIFTFGLSALLGARKKNWLIGLAVAVIIAVALLLCLAIGFWLLWALLALGMLLVAFFSPRKTKIISLAVFVFSVVMIFFPISFKSGLPVVVNLSYTSGFNIAKQVLLENPLRFILGSGPGTFSYDYDKYKPVEVNNTILWSVNFDRAKSHFVTGLATTGVLGAMLWLLFVLVLGFKAWRGQSDRAVLSAWLLSVAAHLVYSSNLTLSFLFWFLSALLAGQIISKIKEVDLRGAPRIRFLFSFGFAAAAVFSIFILFAVGRGYVSEVVFAQAVKLDGSGAPTEQVTAKINQAVSFNGFSDVLYRNFSQAILKQTQRYVDEATKDGTAFDENETATLHRLLQAAMAAIDRAVVLEPNNVDNWAQRGNVYRDVMKLVGGAEDVAAVSYSRAMKLEPVNPSFPTNLARLYLIVAERAKELSGSDDADLAAKAAAAEPLSLAEAEKYLNQTLVLKSDYAPAIYYLAAVYERQGRLVEAIARMETLRAQAPNDVGVGFQLALLYIEKKDYAAAQKELERIIVINPGYSNAHWFLASVYENTGQLEKAIEQVSKVAELNPDNQIVKTRLEELISGQLSVMVPAPVEEGETEKIQ